MATIKDFDKIRQDVVRPYNVVRPSLLAKTAMCCHVSASIPRLKDSLYAYSLSSAMPKSKAQSSVPSYLSKIAALNKSLNPLPMRKNSEISKPVDSGFRQLLHPVLSFSLPWLSLSKNNMRNHC